MDVYVYMRIYIHTYVYIQICISVLKYVTVLALKEVFSICITSVFLQNIFSHWSVSNDFSKFFKLKQAQTLHTNN